MQFYNIEDYVYLMVQPGREDHISYSNNGMDYVQKMRPGDMENPTTKIPDGMKSLLFEVVFKMYRNPMYESQEEAIEAVIRIITS